MATPKSAQIFKRLDELELSLCLLFNRASHRLIIKRFFAFISRLGDGVFWYVLMLTFALLDFPHGVLAALHMGLVSLLSLYIYRFLKGRMIRQRPSITWSRIRRGTAPLDLYSFPSGHTLHATSFTIIALFYYPGLSWLLIPMAGLIALSRVILGLHYPSDVAVGALIGAGLSLASVELLY